MKITVAFGSWQICLALEFKRHTSQRESSIFSPNGEPGYVYLIRKKDAGRWSYKIGCTNDPKRRMARLIIQHKQPLEILYTVAVGDKYGAEKAFHTLFEHKNTSGEWFTLNDMDVELFAHVANAIGDLIDVEAPYMRQSKVPSLNELTEFLKRGAVEGFSRRYWKKQHLETGERVTAGTWRWWVSYLADIGVLETHSANHGRGAGTRLKVPLEKAIAQLETALGD